MGEDVSGDGEARRFRQQCAELLGGEPAREPVPGGIVPGPDTDVGDATLVPAASAGNQSERSHPDRSARLQLRRLNRGDLLQGLRLERGGIGTRVPSWRTATCGTSVAGT